MTSQFYKALASINLLRKIIILEQYLILTLNPSLNTVKVANTAPYTDHSDLSPEKWNKMVTSMSQPIYLYLDDVLVFEAPIKSKILLVLQLVLVNLVLVLYLSSEIWY